MDAHIGCQNGLKSIKEVFDTIDRVVRGKIK